MSSDGGGEQSLEWPAAWWLPACWLASIWLTGDWLYRQVPGGTPVPLHSYSTVATAAVATVESFLAVGAVVTFVFGVVALVRLRWPGWQESQRYRVIFEIQRINFPWDDRTEKLVDSIWRLSNAVVTSGPNGADQRTVRFPSAWMHQSDGRYQVQTGHEVWIGRPVDHTPADDLFTLK